MGRVGVLIAFAIIGYFIGVAAYYLGKNLAPWLAQFLPWLLQADWVIAGILGAIVTIILVIVWSYTTKSS
jgi:hypothetical protein